MDYGTSNCKYKSKVVRKFRLYHLIAVERMDAHADDMGKIVVCDHQSCVAGVFQSRSTCAERPTITRTSSMVFPILYQIVRVTFTTSKDENKKM